MQSEEVLPVTNVHQALTEAAIKEKNRVTLVNANFKIDPIKKTLAEQICEKHGATLSSFMRECVEGLVKDYMGPKASKKLSGE